ncbi:MAG: ethylbenzene dehydrogenase [Chloroflexi bacterium]|nr:ethylbenzene dehydrogenase [Chloroflexota bacterium]
MASLAVAGIAGAADPTNLTSVKVDKAPTIDGQVDSLWNSAPGVTLDVAGGANLPASATKVNLYSVYTSDSVYFLAEYWDPSQSLRRAPWQKQADGTWKKLSDPNDKGGDNNLVYEDKLAFLWNINDSIKGFNEIGCAAVCHAGEPPKPFGNKYTASKGELGDIWHWKSVRTNPNSQIDDQYLDDTRYDATNSPEAGRKSDPKTAGGYSDNQTDDKKAPKYAAPDQKPAPPYWIFDKDKVALDDTKYKANDEVAGIITAPIQGDRGDISAQGAWKDGKWTLEWGRKLNTGSQFDVQYADLSKSYAFGVAVFDNAAVRHATSGLAKLTFEQAAAPAPTALPRTGGPTVPVLPIALGAGILAILGFALRLKLARR